MVQSNTTAVRKLPIAVYIVAICAISVIPMAIVLSVGQAPSVVSADADTVHSPEQLKADIAALTLRIETLETQVAALQKADSQAKSYRRKVRDCVREIAPLFTEPQANGLTVDKTEADKIKTECTPIFQQSDAECADTRQLINGEPSYPRELNLEVAARNTQWEVRAVYYIPSGTKITGWVQVSYPETQTSKNTWATQAEAQNVANCAQKLADAGSLTAGDVIFINWLASTES